MCVCNLNDDDFHQIKWREIPARDARQQHQERVCQRPVRMCDGTRRPVWCVQTSGGHAFAIAREEGRDQAIQSLGLNQGGVRRLPAVFSPAGSGHAHGEATPGDLEGDARAVHPLPSLPRVLALPGDERCESSATVLIA